MAKKPRKVRVDFRANRQERRRVIDFTRQFRGEEDEAVDSERVESVRAKGELSRKRTILVDDRNLPVVAETEWIAGTVVKVHGLICYVRDPLGFTWDCTVRRILRTRLIATRSPVTVGDRVWFSDQSRVHDGDRVGVIERVAPRTSFLARQDRRQRAHAIVANADQLLAVLSIAQPRLRPHLADRYIVAAMKGGVTPVLCFNKIDLLDPELLTDEEEYRASRPPVEEVIDEFRRLGHRCISTSALTGAGVDEMREVLQNHTTVLSGQSGVGKSSLLNALQPGMMLATAAVSTETEKGRHTTTLAELFPLDFGGYVVDTPGIRAFELWSVQRGELEAFFVEFLPYIQKCRFNNCLHGEEDGCAIRAAVEHGEISERRYFSYLKMLEEV